MTKNMKKMKEKNIKWTNEESKKKKENPKPI